MEISFLVWAVPNCLSTLKKSGSIVNAAKAMGMSYKKAWAMVDDMNSKAKEPYVVAKRVVEEVAELSLQNLVGRF